MKNPIIIRIPYIFPRIQIHVGSWCNIRHLIFCRIGQHEYVEINRYEWDDGYALEHWCMHCLHKKYEVKHNREAMALPVGIDKSDTAQ